MTESYSALCEIIGRHFDIALVADQNADAGFTHLARWPRNDLMVVLMFYAEHSVREFFRHCAGKLEQFFFGHNAFYRFHLVSALFRRGAGAL